MKLIALLALATTLRTQDLIRQECFREYRNDKAIETCRNVTVEKPQLLEMKDGLCFNCNQWNRYDGNGALEAFYVRPAHHSILKSKRFWFAVGAVAGSAALTGYLASRSSSYRPGAPTVPQQQGQLAPTVDSVTRIGIGGPGVPVVAAKGGGD